MVIRRCVLEYVNFLVIENLSIKLAVKIVHYTFQTGLFLWICFADLSPRKKAITLNITDAIMPR